MVPGQADHSRLVIAAHAQVLAVPVNSGPKPQFGAGKPYQDAKSFQGDRPARPSFRPAGEAGYRSRPATGGRSDTKPFRGRSGEDKGRWKNSDGERPRSARTGREQSSERPRREGAEFDRPQFDRPRYDRAKPSGSGQRNFRRTGPQRSCRFRQTAAAARKR